MSPVEQIEAAIGKDDALPRRPPLLDDAHQFFHASDLLGGPHSHDRFICEP